MSENHANASLGELLSTLSHLLRQISAQSKMFVKQAANKTVTLNQN